MIMQCPGCKKQEGEVNHPPGMVFVGWGTGWQPCPRCSGSGSIPDEVLMSKDVEVLFGRDALVKLAQETVDGINLPAGARAVVIITDASGDWVGVGTNTSFGDTQAILRSAMEGADLKLFSHPNRRTGSRHD
jgi:hypothetical protein